VTIGSRLARTKSFPTGNVRQGGLAGSELGRPSRMPHRRRSVTICADGRRCASPQRVVEVFIKGPPKGIGIVAVLDSQPLASNELIDLGFA
jgi:hypothetical protein